ncbi:protein ALP1-like [Rhagoletis pomonella]|uniref:protein ALP1-like n=1 Tax=Rhagoletis pomonella TaxID=28610 RepID=UPI00178233CA|nr:protein ALP1-like [Rhagoletis pomonella]
MPNLIKDAFFCSSSSIHYADDEEIIEILADVAAEASSSGDDSEEEQVEHPKFVGFIDVIDEYADEDFKSHFRLNRKTVDYLITRYNENDQNHSRTMSGKPKIPAKTMIYMYIWYLSNTITYRQLANLFGVTKSTAWAIVRRVVAWIISIGYEFITWPTGKAVEDTTRKFLQRKKVPGVIGAIDCTHITINAPKKDKHIYFDRKRNYSLVLQEIVDADMKFIDIYCGEPGSYHDFRVLKRSASYRKAENSVENLFPNSTFTTVFKDYGSLTEQQIRLNKIHSSARIVVENAFGLLKGRFRRLLKFTEHKDLCAVTHLVASACIMHNINILKNDDTFMKVKVKVK